MEMDDAHAIRALLDNQVEGWNKGDAAQHGRDIDDDVIATNIRGQSFAGADAFIKQHEMIFGSIFRGTTVSQEIDELRFPSMDVAVVRVVTALSGFPEVVPGLPLDAKGRLRTKLLQVLARRGDHWKVVAYHNVDVKPGVEVPEPGTTK
jgi:uncharacterized protein (TIGR02246 family)